VTFNGIFVLPNIIRWLADDYDIQSDVLFGVKWPMAKAAGERYLSGRRGGIGESRESGNSDGVKVMT